MESEFKLIEDVNPSKTPIRIKKKFAKLTLTSNKKTTANTASKETTVKKSANGDSDSDDQRRNKIQSEKMARVSRSLLKDLLTDDESESEAVELNRLFLSRMTQKPDAIVKQNHRTSSSNSTNQRESKISMPFTDKLEVSDSDVTNCSEYESTSSSLTNIKDVNLESTNGNNTQHTEMEKLHVSDEETKQQSSESLFEANQNDDKEMDILSIQVTQLGIKSPPANTKVDTEELHLSEKKRIAEADTLSISTNQRISTESSNIQNNVVKAKEISILCPVTPTRSHKSLKHNIKEEEEDNESIYTVSSGSSSVQNVSVNISETDDDDDGVVLVISDTDSENSINMQISEVKQSNEKISLPSTVENTKDERLQEFLDNIPPVQPGIECLSHDESVPLSKRSYNFLPNVQRFRGNLKDENESYIEDSIEIGETSNEIEDNVKTESVQQSQNEVNENQTPTKTSPAKTESQISISHSTPCIEKINISAKIKIQVHIKEPTITYSVDSPENENSNDEDNSNEEKVSEKSLLQPEQKVETNDDDLSETKQTQPEFIESEKNTPSQNKFTPITINDSDEFKFDDVAINLLTKLYGNEWQTPEIIQKLDKTLSFSKKNDESTLSNFSKFRRNILPDLQSTKLRQTAFMNDILEESGNFKKPIATIKPMREIQKENKENNLEKEEDDDESFRIKKPNKGVRKKVLPRRPYRIESDSSDDKSSSNDASDEDFSGDSDVSWKAAKKSSPSSSSSSPSPSSYNSKTKKRQKTTKKKNTDKIIYLDLTEDYIKVQENHKSPLAEKDATFPDKLEKILGTFRYKEKSKLPATPVQSATKPKRKLFTPRYDEEEIDTQLEKNLQKLMEDISLSRTDEHLKNEIIHKKQSEENNENEKVEEDEDDLIKLKYMLPPAFSLINKKIESVKTGTPISKMKTSENNVDDENEKKKGKRTGTPNKKKNQNSDENCSSNEKISTPRNLKNTKTPLPDKTSGTPLNKYGFLRSLDVMTNKAFCHPEALYYKENFKTKKDELTTKLYNLYNEKVFDNKLDVKISWNKKLLTTAGRCFNKKIMQERNSRIELSEKVITSADRLRCTLIHELCHAATWIFNGEHGHNSTWKGWAKKVNKIFPELPEIKVCHKYEIEYKYTYMCTLCQAKSYAHSKSKKTENIRCAYCHGAIEVYLNRKNKDGNVMHTPVREPTGFAKFVKENYKLYRTSNRKHADVMKILSNEFASLDVKEKK